MQIDCENMDIKKNVSLETALELTGFGKYNILLLLMASVALLAVSMDLMSMSYTVPAAACELNLAMNQKGFLAAAPMMGLVVMSYPWGYIADTRGRRFSLLISMSMGFVLAVLSSFSVNIVSLAILKFLTGAFSSAANSVTYTLLGESLPKKYRDRMLFYLTASLMFSGAVVAVIAWPILGYMHFKYPLGFLGLTFSPWRLYLIVLAIPLGLTSILLIFIPETPKFLILKGKPEEALKVLRKMYAMNTGNKADTYQVESLIYDETTLPTVNESFLTSLWTQFSPLFKKPLLKHSCMLYSLQVGIFFVSNTLFLWLPQTTITFLDGIKREGASNLDFCSIVTKDQVLPLFNSTKQQEMVLLPPTTEACEDTLQLEAFIVMIILSGTCGVLNMVFASLVKFTGKKCLILGIFVTCGTCCLMGTIIHYAWAGFILILITLTVCLVMGMTPSYIVDLYPTSLRGMAVCMAIMIGRLAGMSGANLYGFVIENYCHELYYFVSFVCFACAILALCLPAEEAKTTTSELPHKVIISEETWKKSTE